MIADDPWPAAAAASGERAGLGGGRAARTEDELASKAPVAGGTSAPPSRPAVDALRRASESGLRAVALVPPEAEAGSALAAGARGVLLRDTDAPALGAALEAVSRGLLVLDERLARSVLRPSAPTPEPLLEPLTPRETEVLQLLAQGLTNHLIAQRLRISDHTAKFHVTAIMGNLGAQTRSEAIVQAARLGLVIL